MRAALLQLTSGDDPEANRAALVPMVRQAAAEGARLICTPEVTNVFAVSRARREAMVVREDEDLVIDALRDEAARAGAYIALGSAAVRTDRADGRLANRSLLIGPDGQILARYDKIHMFDVSLPDGESFRESAAYAPGDRAVVAEVDGRKVGLTICYDLRFPHLYRALSKAGAEILLVPSAFATTTGRAHWEVLLRARAIECGAYVLAAAQTGTHPVSDGANPRRTWGHSLAVGPWGEVLADAGTDPGVTLVDLDFAAVETARSRVPALTHDREFTGP